ncbi:hypothetical protein C7974DRAFT_385015 [Boeremia exigua]|uniref:uncharacterized protein n=1 Tax=Boeremia exigua TaxID=749465 RepID=UPI001E8E032E|nr:uncharacterized protein C7974DRAFT_385015 [Boeremia exigua]KAH6642191.1 hypothetical protein C7974DRAFT_385015 [Boeremia exigua]
MGRTEKSQGLAPPAIRKDIRAKQARHIINKVVPAILASNPKARRGADTSELVSDPGPASSKQIQKLDEGGEDAAYVKRKGQGRRKAKGGQDIDEEHSTPSRGKSKKSGKRGNDSLDENVPYPARSQSVGPTSRTIRIVTTDSLTAAQMLASEQCKKNKKPENVCILNMASPLRPGGGVLSGATSQEEFLCARTTLLPSLKEDYYRLPEFGGIFSPNVLVFRTPGPLGDGAGELGAGERYWVDVISAGMLRFPDLEGEEEEVKRLGNKDRDVVERKMKAVLRIAAAKGVKRLVLGAWGCGAYGNPVIDVARAWSRVLTGSSIVGAQKAKSGPAEVWSDLEDVIFAITNPKTANDFANAFDVGVQVEDGPRNPVASDENEGGEDTVAQELRSKIEEMESQVSKVWNADLKSRLATVLEGLRVQLRERESGEVERNPEMSGDEIDTAGYDSDGDIDQPDADSDDVGGVVLKS